MSARRPRVLFVGAFPPADRKVFGGMVTSCRALLRSSLPEHLDLDLLDTTQASHPPPPLHVRALLAVKRFAIFVVRFSRQRPDAVLLFTSVGASVVEKGAMAWYARLHGVPALTFPRGGSLIDACRRSRFTRIWVRAALRGSRMLLCQGSAWRAFACDVLGFKPDQAPIIPNWTATEEFLAIGRSRRIELQRRVRFLFVGWLDQEKGVAELLAACRELAADQFELVLIGEGNMSQAAREYAQAHGLADVLMFRGWLEGEALRAEYAAADVFVLPSWSEGLPNAMIEGMAARLAIVVTAVGNIPDVLTDRASAMLVRPRDASELQEALALLLRDAQLRERLATAGFAIAQERFGVESAVSGICASIRVAMGSSAAALSAME